MNIALISLVAFIGSGLTFFSGFGLGTILLPVFALFFPLNVAVALTGTVHFLNNLFKLFLVGRFVDKATLLRFSLPSIPAAILGSLLLLSLSEMSPLLTYDIGGRTFAVLPIKLIIGALMVVFALFDVLPRFQRLHFRPSLLPVGGLISGFFGGLSGHQGALRSAFLVRVGLSKEAFIGTGIVTACLVDISRLSIYWSHFGKSELWANPTLLAAATLSAFLGAFLGNRFLKKITMESIKIMVSAMLMIIALLLAVGII